MKDKEGKIKWMNFLQFLKSDNFATLKRILLCGNWVSLLTVLSIYHFYRTLISYLLVNLAIADMVFAIFIAPSVLLRLTSFHPEGMIAAGLCKFVTGGNVGWIGAVSSIFSLIAIAVERYYSVIYPFRWNLTKPKLKVCKG